MLVYYAKTWVHTIAIKVHAINELSRVITFASLAMNREGIAVLTVVELSHLL